jgi:uncharacterized protein YuzE
MTRKEGDRLLSVRVGDQEFEHVDYDRDADVLYLHVGAPRRAARTLATPEGHALRYDDSGMVIGVTLVNAHWLHDRDGYVSLEGAGEGAVVNEDDLTHVFLAGG